MNTKTNNAYQTKSCIDYLSRLSPLIEGLHSMAFGVVALDDPNFTHKALSDDGQLHEYIHMLVRALPSDEELNKFKNDKLD